MISIEITDKNQNIIFSNISIEHKKIFKDNKSSKKNGTRSLFKEDKNNVGLWLITDDSDCYKSTRTIKKTFVFLSDFLTGIHQHYATVTLSNTHTIATIQAKMSQQIEILVGGVNQRGNYQAAMDNVERIIQEDTQVAAKTICDLNKRIEEIDTHLKSLRIIENKTEVNLTPHPLQKALLNIYSPFLDDFKEKKINFNFNKIDEDLKILVDYKIFSLVMHHFFDNAVKYSKDNDEISFVYSRDDNLVISQPLKTI